MDAISTPPPIPIALECDTCSKPGSHGHLLLHNVRARSAVRPYKACSPMSSGVEILSPGIPKRFWQQVEIIAPAALFADYGLPYLVNQQQDSLVLP